MRIRHIVSMSHLRRAALLVTLASAGTLAGCSSQEKQDELGRLLSEREQLREDISRAKMTGESLISSLAEPVPVNSPIIDEPPPVRTTVNNDPDFGDNTSTSRRGGDLVVEVAGDVLFDPGSITLKSTSKRTLDRVARVILDRYRGNTIRVEGYTDTDPLKKTAGKYDSNEELSAKRALAVEKYLVSKGCLLYTSPSPRD